MLSSMYTSASRERRRSSKSSTCFSRFRDSSVEGEGVIVSSAPTLVLSALGESGSSAGTEEAGFMEKVSSEMAELD